MRANELIKTIAGLLKDGEANDWGHVFDLSSDDAVDTLHRIIDDARNIRAAECDSRIAGYLDVSTANVTEHDMRILKGKTESGVEFTTVAKYEYGVFVGVPDDPEEFHNDIVNILLFSTAFYDLLLYARANGCDVLRLDEDGEIINELRTFEW